MDKPDCYRCRHMKVGDAHMRVACTNSDAIIDGYWGNQEAEPFAWRESFDPRWLRSCDGYDPRVATLMRDVTVYAYMPLTGQGAIYGATSDTLDQYAIDEIRAQGRMLLEETVQVPDVRR